MGKIANRTIPGFWPSLAPSDLICDLGSRHLLYQDLHQACEAEGGSADLQELGRASIRSLRRRVVICADSMGLTAEVWFGTEPVNLCSRAQGHRFTEHWFIGAPVHLRFTCGSPEHRFTCAPVNEKTCLFDMLLVGQEDISSCSIRRHVSC